ncbi:MAG: EF-hand domain-containing protein [Deltaproteobacteria bacterium]|nr:EF-hand domain-containing protein [Deltaproteobacteria bacterium]
MRKFKLVFGMCMVVFILGANFSFAQTPENLKIKAKESIDAMDTNKDGKISKEEFLAKCKGANCSQRFDALDTNKDGFLDQAEAQQNAANAKEKAAGFRNKMKNKVQSGQQPTN